MTSPVGTNFPRPPLKDISANTPVRRRARPVRPIHTAPAFNFLPPDSDLPSLLSVREPFQPMQKKILDWGRLLNFSISHIAILHAKIKDICEQTEWSQERKWGELATLYFYLLRDQTLVLGESYLEMRQTEISREADSLQLDHFDAVAATVSQSGRVSYTLHSFARMIITADGVFHREGCYAVLHLLETPVATHLGEETREQIVSVVKSLLVDDGLVQLLMNPTQVHESLIDFLRCDVQIGTEDRYTQIHTAWAQLFALFRPVGQLDGQGNCYAVGPVYNLMRQKPQLVLTLIQEALTKGTFTLGGVEIPVRPLIESRRNRVEEFAPLVSPTEVSLLSGYALASSVLPRSEEPVAECAHGSQPLENVLRVYYGDALPVAKDRFLSLQRNLVQEMVLAIVQFVAINNPKANEKTKLVSALVSIFGEENLPFIEQSLWLIDQYTASHHTHEDRVVFDVHSQGLKVEKSSFDPKKIFEIRRLAFLTDRGFVFFDKISDVINLFNLFGDTLDDDVFRLPIIKFLRKWNKPSLSLPAQVYADSDSFFLLQDGGQSVTTGVWPLIEGAYNPPVCFESSDVDDFFINLCEKLRAHTQAFPTALSEESPLVLAGSYGHIYNFRPKDFELYWRTDDPRTVRDLEIVVSGRLVADQPLRVSKQKHLLYSALGMERYQEVKEELVQGTPSFLDFMDRAQTVLNRDEVIEIAECAVQILLERTQQEFSQVLPTILTSLGVISTEVNVDFGDRIWFTPYQFARKLQKALLEKERKHFPFSSLERVIASSFQLPQCPVIGNLNYVNSRKERPSFEMLVIAYDFFLGTLGLFIRKIDGSLLPSPDESEFLRYSELYFETPPQ